MRGKEASVAGIAEEARPWRRAIAWLLLLGGTGLDLAFALLTLHPAAGRRLWAAQAAIVALYGAIAAVGLPGLLADPLGAIVKNLALLALLGQLALHAEPD
ncbi:MAG TPA: DoxX-like family protein [Plasticicumulans sp.]|nr:DoxX-like family protein [Plasticicumulans sp.]